MVMKIELVLDLVLRNSNEFEKIFCCFNDPAVKAIVFYNIK